MKLSLYHITLASLLAKTSAFSVQNINHQSARSTPTTSSLYAEGHQTRLSFLQSATAACVALSTQPETASALVKGNAPPPKKGPSEERKCRNVEECQEMAERLASKADEEARANMVPTSVTSRGTRYRELIEAKEGSKVANVGEKATINYKVLKVGKRSYDGLSGEATVVFSMGYGLEDDEEKAGVKSFSFTIGDNQIVSALNDGIQGQAVGSTRRIAVLPQMGWERATRECDGGPGGGGNGGELKTDYVVVPTATMVATETCFDKAKLPFPSTYAEQRRMAQRFDQSLILEVELVGLN